MNNWGTYRLAWALLAPPLSVVGPLLLPVSSEAQPGQPGPTISGPEIEQLLRTRLAAAPGSTADASRIRCPATRDYGDGDVARCTVPVGNGSIQVLLVTLFQEGANWRFAIDVQ